MARINTNIAAFAAQTAYTRNNADLNTHLQRLSTGLRINTGKDDPSGLIASESLRGEISGINQAIDNTTRADNVINTAEGSLNEVNTLLLSLQALNNQAANTGALSTEEIKANQLQTDSILASIDRIANTTQFNGVKLLNGQYDYNTSGVQSTAISTLAINAAKLPQNASQTVAVQVLASAQTGQVVFTGATVGTSAVTIEVGGFQGNTQLSFAANTAASAVAFAVNNLSDSTGVTASADAGGVTFNSQDYGANQYVSVKAISGTFVTGKDFGKDAEVSINGAKASVNGLTATVHTASLDIDLTLNKNFNVPDPAGTSFEITGGGAVFQIGEKVQTQAQIQIGIQSLSTTKLGDQIVGALSSIGSGGNNSLVGGNTVQAQRIIDKAISQVSTIRGRLGALQKNVLETNINSLNVALENVTAAESDIRDADFAAETAALTRSQILVQANQSVLSQANSAPQNVLRLLQ